MSWEEFEKRHPVIAAILDGCAVCLTILTVMILMVVLVGVYKMVLEHEDILLVIAERMGI